MQSSLRYDVSLLNSQDIERFHAGSHANLYECLGPHLLSVDDTPGVLFAVWAPNAEAVSVIGDFNQWSAGTHPLSQRDDDSGIWEVFIPGLETGSRYKYHLRNGDYEADKGDPFARRWEVPPGTAALVWDDTYEWGDQDWQAKQAEHNRLEGPWAIYEVHLGSWQRATAEDGRCLGYQELAYTLGDYLHHMGYTHVELMPVMEHPFYGSWGYQVTGYFAPTSRYGTPEALKFMIDYLHQQGFGVVLDWVPSHFPDDVHGLVYFDGTYLFEHADPQKGHHPEWGSYIFDYGRPEVRSFLLSSARFWLDRYHADGLRVDAVASMLYLDYGRGPGEWEPNLYGGNEDLEAIRFLRAFNETLYRDYPRIQTIAEESTAWPMVSRPTYVGGLGFGMKWNMGWMHDTLSYFQVGPLYRKYHHDQLTGTSRYVFDENFVLPLSHDEVVHGKGSLLGKMPGDDWQRLANLRLLFGYMYAHPGKKLNFMGDEFGQWREWDHDDSLDWHLLERPGHQGVQSWVRDLNLFYRQAPALHEGDFEARCFEWVDAHDWEKSVISFLRKPRSSGEPILVVCNFTPVPRHNYAVGVPRGGWWQEVLNSDAPIYGGSGQGNLGGQEAAPVAAQGQYHSLLLTLPPLGVLFMQHMA